MWNTRVRRSKAACRGAASYCALIPLAVFGAVQKKPTGRNVSLSRGTQAWHSPGLLLSHSSAAVRAQVCISSGFRTSSRVWCFIAHRPRPPSISLNICSVISHIASSRSSAQASPVRTGRTILCRGLASCRRRLRPDPGPLGRLLGWRNGHSSRASPGLPPHVQ